MDDSGSAIYNFEGELIIYGCTFRRNIAGTVGLIFLETKAILEMTFTTVEDNVAADSSFLFVGKFSEV